jgi:hypothetical protein
MRPTFVMPQVDNSITEIHIRDPLLLTKLIRCVRVDLRGYRASHLMKIVCIFHNPSTSIGADVLQLFDICPAALISIRETSRPVLNWAQISLKAHLRGQPMVIGLTLASPASTDQTGKTLRFKIRHGCIERQSTLSQAQTATCIHVPSISRPSSHLKATTLMAWPPR